MVGGDTDGTEGPLNGIKLTCNVTVNKDVDGASNIGIEENIGYILNDCVWVAEQFWDLSVIYIPLH
jgi:hypothetical protein